MQRFTKCGDDDGWEFQTIKDTGVKAQMEGVKWLQATITPPAHFGK